MRRPPNILLVILDATRPDACSCYVPAGANTPTLAQLAQEGCRYEQAISPAPWTLPAVASLLTGHYPSQIGVYENYQLPPTWPTLPQILADAGYATFAISNNGWFSNDFGLPRGFQTMHKQWQWWQGGQDINQVALSGGGNGLWGRLRRGNWLQNLVNMAFTRWPGRNTDSGAHRILPAFQRWLGNQTKPWFALVHYLEAHLPYHRPGLGLPKDPWPLLWHYAAGLKPLGADLLALWRQQYLAEVAYMDGHLGQLLAWLRQMGQLDQTLLIVLADHGENLGEHGLFDHQYNLYDTVLHVPLLIRYPGLVPAGATVTAQVQTLDIFPTILQVVGLNGVQSAGYSLLAGSGREATLADYCAPPLPNLARYGLTPTQVAHLPRQLLAWRTNSHKLIYHPLSGRAELYAWPQDPHEQHDLAASQPRFVQQLTHQLQQWQQANHSTLPQNPPSFSPSEPAVHHRLRALGYIE